MVGDRLLTDVLYGNRHGMLTVSVRPFGRDAAAVRVARAVEGAASRRWARSGVRPPPLPVLGGPEQQAAALRRFLVDGGGEVET